jgi:hypothetical protein
MILREREAQRYLQRLRRRYIARGATGSAIVLAIMALILVLMPVSYRAGTESAHPHTVFQVIVDEVRGEAHGHAGDRATSHTHERQSSPSASLFLLSLNVPLSMYASLNDPGAAFDSMVRMHNLAHSAGIVLPKVDPDLPILTSVHGVSESASALTQFILLAALLLFVQPLRRVWFSSDILRGISQAIEGPPPRVSISIAQVHFQQIVDCLRGDRQCRVRLGV